jgi:hypothetical protein
MIGITHEKLRGGHAVWLMLVPRRVGLGIMWYG